MVEPTQHQQVRCHGTSHFYGLVPKRCNSSVSKLEFHLFSDEPSIVHPSCWWVNAKGRRRMPILRNWNYNDGLVQERQWSSVFLTLTHRYVPFAFTHQHSTKSTFVSNTPRQGTDVIHLSSISPTGFHANSPVPLICYFISHDWSFKN